MQKHLKDYLIPHAGNDYRPHSLQKAAVMGMVLMILLSFGIANLQTMVWISSDWLVSTILPAVVVDLTNEERAAGELLGLRRSPTLDLAAKRKAEHMAEHEYFAHFSPDGVSPWHWFDVVGYHYVHAGENLAVHFVDSGEVVTAWMRSPAHRANILNGNYTEIGVGTAEGYFEGFKTVYVVQLFGTPEASRTFVDTESVTPISQVVTLPSNQPGTASVLSGSDVDSGEVIPVVEKTDQADREVTETDQMSTSTIDIPVTNNSETIAIEPELSASVPKLSAIATRPGLVLMVLYSLIGSFVLLALLLSVCIEIKRQEPVQVAYALMLLLLMFGLHQVHVLLTSGALVV